MPEPLTTARKPAGVRVPRALLKGRLGLSCAAECLGTFIIVFFGLGAVHAAVLAKAHSGLFQVAIVWGIGVAIAIHATAAISGAHLNPAVTGAFALLGGFPKRDVLPYWGSQVLGAFLAAGVLYAIFGGFLEGAEGAAGIVRGGPGSEVTAMCYGEYFPSPGLGPQAHPWVSESTAFLAEFISTALLVFVIFAFSESSNAKAPGPMTPAFIGLTVAALVGVIAPITQACLNPARDLGPRLFSWLAGWGKVAIPGPRGGFFTVYIVAPLTGALLGALLFRLVFKHGYGPPPAEAAPVSPPGEGT